jgi:hypothetical protein
MTSSVASRPVTLPTLESGDRLNREEFHKRYLLRPDIKKAELVNGVVYVSSPKGRRRFWYDRGDGGATMTSSVASRPATLPTLESGDRLSREEFHARYLLRPDIKKAELVNGVVYVPSPTRDPQHAQPHFLLNAELGVYQRRTLGVIGSNNGTVFLGLDDEVQPDVALRWAPEYGGQAELDENGYVQGAPELVAEIAASSVSYDMHDKLQVYLRAGVQEYIVWLVEEARIVWFRLRDSQYVALEPGADGLTKSEVFPGLALNLNALVAEARRPVTKPQS